MIIFFLIYIHNVTANVSLFDLTGLITGIFKTKVIMVKF
jgi:hypothetical protein